MIKMGTTTILAAALSASGLAAQQHQHVQARDSTRAAAQQEPGPMGTMQGGMMAGQGMAMMPAHDVMQRAMRLAPARLLAHKDDLGLTPQQTVELARLAARDSAMPQGQMAAMHQAAEELTRHFDAAKPDTAAVRAAAERLAVRHGTLHAQRLATAAAVRGILSAAQLEKAMLLGHGDMPSMMEGMMRGGGMMPGMMPHGRPESPPEHSQHHQPPPDSDR